MLTLKKEKGKQKHPNEKLNERAQQVGPKPEMACAKESEKSYKENRESPEVGSKPKLA